VLVEVLNYICSNEFFDQSIMSVTHRSRNCFTEMLGMVARKKSGLGPTGSAHLSTRHPGSYSNLRT
jgi:hypothetical protein